MFVGRILRGKPHFSAYSTTILEGPDLKSSIGPDFFLVSALKLGKTTFTT